MILIICRLLFESVREWVGSSSYTHVQLSDGEVFVVPLKERTSGFLGPALGVFDAFGIPVEVFVGFDCVVIPMIKI